MIVPDEDVVDAEADELQRVGPKATRPAVRALIGGALLEEELPDSAFAGDRRQGPVIGAELGQGLTQDGEGLQGFDRAKAERRLQRRFPIERAPDPERLGLHRKYRVADADLDLLP